MSAIAAGMESDLSDEEGDIVFSTSKASEKKGLTDTNDEKYRNFTHAKVENNGSINKPNQRYDSKANSRGSSKFCAQHRSQPQHAQRQCIDFKSSQLLEDLRYAIIQGNLETTQNIYSRDIFVDVILKAEWTGLMYASSSGHADIVAFLLEKKADPNYHKDMFTSLMATCAARKNEIDLLKCCSLLLKHGAKVNARDRYFTTSLMFAVREGYTLIVRELLENGADLGMQDNRGKTALAWAAASGYGQIIRMLLEKGADVQIITNMGQSPIDLAYENGHNEVVSLLQKSDMIKQMSLSENSSELVPKTVDMFQVKTKDKVFTKVSEIDIFLSGVGLSDVIPKFAKHDLNLTDLLAMDDDELEKIGISELGIRKKILDASKSVHKKDWENSSLPNLKQSQCISCPDAVSMMANIAKHMKYISSSVIYIHRQIQSNPKILELAKDSVNVHNLMDETDESLKNIKHLNEELKILKMHLGKIQDSAMYQQSDLVVHRPLEKRRNSVFFSSIMFIGTASVAVAGILWKYPSFFGSIPIYIRIKIPFLS